MDDTWNSRNDLNVSGPRRKLRFTKLFSLSLPPFLGDTSYLNHVHLIKITWVMCVGGKVSRLGGANETSLLFLFPSNDVCLYFFFSPHTFPLFSGTSESIVNSKSSRNKNPSHLHTFRLTSKKTKFHAINSWYLYPRSRCQLTQMTPLRNTGSYLV